MIFESNCKFQITKSKHHQPQNRQIIPINLPHAQKSSKTRLSEETTASIYLWIPSVGWTVHWMQANNLLQCTVKYCRRATNHVNHAAEIAVWAIFRTARIESRNERIRELWENVRTCVRHSEGVIIYLPFEVLKDLF